MTLDDLLAPKLGVRIYCSKARYDGHYVVVSRHLMSRVRIPNPECYSIYVIHDDGTVTLVQANMTYYKSHRRAKRLKYTGKDQDYTLRSGGK